MKCIDRDGLPREDEEDLLQEVREGASMYRGVCVSNVVDGEANAFPGIQFRGNHRRYGHVVEFVVQGLGDYSDFF